MAKMSEEARAIELVVRRDCGFETRGTEQKLIHTVQKHGFPSPSATWDEGPLAKPPLAA